MQVSACGRQAHQADPEGYRALACLPPGRPGNGCSPTDPLLVRAYLVKLDHAHFPSSFTSSMRFAKTSWQSKRGKTPLRYMINRNGTPFYLVWWPF